MHEYVHALQDLHFDLATGRTSDAFLARRALTEGDATMAEYRHVVLQLGYDLPGTTWDQTLTSYRECSDRLLGSSSYPRFFVAYTAFAYTFGLECRRTPAAPRAASRATFLSTPVPGKAIASCSSATA